MALDIRLDYVSVIKDDYINRMTEIRKKFIALDEEFKIISDEAFETNNNAAARSIALARTNNEIALQSTIKSLCLLGEIK